MLNLDELKFVSKVLKDSESQDEMTLSIIDKINETVSECEKSSLCLWSFFWDCRRQGEVEGLFTATKEEVDAAIGKQVYFGEILGKHSDVYGTLEEGEITLESDDPLVVLNAKESGYNPLDYLRYDCPICESSCSADEWDFENGRCEYCGAEEE